jgi:hypothetical protein
MGIGCMGIGGGIASSGGGRNGRCMGRGVGSHHGGAVEHHSRFQSDTNGRAVGRATFVHCRQASGRTT